jgi:hypothetical protein
LNQEADHQSLAGKKICMMALSGVVTWLAALSLIPICRNMISWAQCTLQGISVGGTFCPKNGHKRAF